MHATATKAIAMTDSTATFLAIFSAIGLTIKQCGECGGGMLLKRDHKRFCSAACRKTWNNRQTVRGGPVMPILQAWHMTRHAKPGTREAEINRYARRELTSIASIFNEQDREAGRMSPLDVVGALMDSASLYVDRVR